MQRRAFFGFVGGAAAWPVVARGQQRERVRRIGVMVGLAGNDPEMQARLMGLRQGLEALGWMEGRNLHVDYRFAPAMGTDQAQTLAKELLALQPEVILASTTPLVAAFQKNDRSIPIVFVNVSDPIGSGFIDSLARPGRNTTGLLLIEATITGKWMAMLKEIAPQLKRVAIMANPKTTPFNYFLQAAQELAPTLAVEVVPSPVEGPADIERSIAAFASSRLDSGLVLLPDATTQAHSDLVIALATRYRLPTVSDADFMVKNGALMSYGVDRINIYRQASVYIDRILRGEKPADLPVQAPTKYETVLNLKTAKALGLTVPDLLLVRADEVIE